MVKEIRSLRSQVHVEKDKIALGVEVLKYYIQSWKNNPYKLKQTQTIEKEIELDAQEVLSHIAQSEEYKFVWDQAYKNPVIFSTVKYFAEHIYNYVSVNIEKKFIIDNLIHQVLFNLMEEDKKQIILELHSLYLENENFIYEINNYPNIIQNLGLDLLYKILKSTSSYTEKINWLKKTISFLANPSADQLKKYNDEIHAALIHPSLELQVIGGAMILLGVGVILVSLVACMLASGGFLGIALATIAAGCFGASQIVIGKLVYDHGSSDQIARASQLLVNEVVQLNLEDTKSYSIF